MNTPTIAVYAICRNEQAYVPAWLETVQGADYVLVCDTGSTDGTLDRLRGQVNLCSASIQPWRFDTARNVALALVPPWIDICVVLDLDETLSPHWRDAILDNWHEGVNGLAVWYQNSEGYEGWDGRRVHSRSGWVWRHPVHEQLYPYLIEPRVASVPDITIRHPRTYLHGDYLPLCELAITEDPTDAHAQYFLGREYFNAGRFEDAAAMLSRYLEQDTEVEERRQATIFLSRAQEALLSLLHS